MQNRYDQGMMVINPTEMTNDEAVILNYLLENPLIAHENYFDQKFIFHIPCQMIEHNTDILLGQFVTAELTHPIVKRSKKNDAKQFRYEVFGDKIGGGGLAEVYRTIGTLVPSLGYPMQLKKSTPRIVKQMTVDKREEKIIRTIIKQEYAMTSRDEDLGVKLPVILNQGGNSPEIKAVLVMKYIPGEELQKMIDLDYVNRKTVNNIDTDTRIKMSIAVARAIDKVHQNKIVHGDIKSTNIMLNMHSAIMQAKVIDFGGSKDKDDHSLNEYSYTIPFAAPEVKRKISSSELSDVYSSIWVFNDIWRGDHHPAVQYEVKIQAKIHEGKIFDIIKKNDKLIKKAYHVPKHWKFENLFYGIHDLDKNHRQQIKKLLKGMSDLDENKRGRMRDVVSLFEEIRLERLISKIKKMGNENQGAKEKYITELKRAHDLGIQLRGELDKLVKYELTIITERDLSQIKDIFKEKNISLLIDQKEVIELFIERLEIMAIAGLKTKKEISGKIFEIVDLYRSNIEGLNIMKVEINELKQEVDLIAKNLIQVSRKFDQERLQQKLLDCENQITTILKNQKHQVTVDKINSLNVKLQHHTAKLRSAINLVISEIKMKQEEFSKETKLDQCLQTAKYLVGQFGLFNQNPVEQKPKSHEVRITNKNYKG